MDLRGTMRLVAPAVEHRDSFLRALREFQAEGLSWWLGPGVELAERDFAAFVAGKRAEAQPRADGAPAKTHLWAIAEGRFVGRIAIFHGLTEALRRSGGHIGYDTVPSCRGRGVATEDLSPKRKPRGNAQWWSGFFLNLKVTSPSLTSTITWPPSESSPKSSSSPSLLLISSCSTRDRGRAP